MRRNKMVLIAEDDPIASLIMTNMVNELGYSTTASEDGQAALAFVESGQKVDILITDVQMPRMDGLELIRRLRTDSRWKGKPILIVSGVVGPNEVASFLDEGATFFLPKPVRIEDLRQYLYGLD